MAIENKRMQQLRGKTEDFDPTKLLAGEWAVTVDSDRRSQKIYMCIAPGIVKQMGTYEDFDDMFADATAEIKADVGKFGTQLAVEHTVLQPLCDSSGESLLDSSGNNLSGRVVFADEGEIVTLRQTVTNLESVVKDLVNKLIYLRDHALLNDQY